MMRGSGMCIDHRRAGSLSFPLLLLILTLLAGCAAHTPPSRHAVTGIDGVACVGRINTPPSGLVETKDESLLHKALGASGKGKLCAGEVFVAAKPVAVYRVWDSARGYTLYGSWWSFNPPKGPRNRYRKANDICPEWSALNRQSACTLKTGAEIVVGPGQSAVCDQSTLAKSAVNQVFIPNDSRNHVLYVTQCSKGTDFP
jgi:hypothetical protein